MKDVLAFVQARMGSSRLPGKSLMELWKGRSVLEVLLRRLAKSKSLDGIVVATSDAPGDAAIEALCRKMKVPCFRGDEKDVLGRFAAAARTHPARWIVRVCADNPLTDPKEVDRLVSFCRDKGLGYAYNNRPECALADGLGAEVMTAACLERLAREALSAEEREHVTYRAFKDLKDFSGARCAGSPGLDRPGVSLDVDHPADLEFLRALCARLDQRRGPHWTGAEILAALP